MTNGISLYEVQMQRFMVTVHEYGHTHTIADIPAAGVSVKVAESLVGSDHPGNVVTVYEDQDLTTPLEQPLATDENGVIPGYIDRTKLPVDFICTGGPLPSGITRILVSNTQGALARLI